MLHSYRISLLAFSYASPRHHLTKPRGTGCANQHIVGSAPSKDKLGGLQQEGHPA